MPDDGPARTWPEGWYSFDSADGTIFEVELDKELAPGHQLFGLPLRAIGRKDGYDDVVFEVNDRSGRVAVAHLTWTGKRDTPPWPESAILSNFAAWAEYESQFE